MRMKTKKFRALGARRRRSIGLYLEAQRSMKRSTKHQSGPTFLKPQPTMLKLFCVYTYVVCLLSAVTHSVYLDEGQNANLHYLRKHRTQRIAKIFLAPTGETILLTYQRGFLAINYLSNFMHLRECSDGNSLVLSVWEKDGEQLMDCDIIKEPKRIDRFLKRFQRYKNSKKQKNIGAVDLIKNGTVWNFRNFHEETENCYQTQRTIRQQRNLLNKVSKTPRVERETDKMTKLKETVEKGNGSAETNDIPKLPPTASPLKATRTKRSIGSGLYSLAGSFKFWGGTKWCGVGNRAENYNDLGAAEETDKCCRQHDLQCSEYIVAGGTKYNYKNWRWYTISSCDCDIRFKNCLQQANTTTAHQIGRFYFNWFGMPCFNVEYERICKMKWWGRCEKWAIEQVAVSSDSAEYIDFND